MGGLFLSSFLWQCSGMVINDSRWGELIYFYGSIILSFWRSALGLYLAIADKAEIKNLAGRLVIASFRL